jgi:subtilase family serine protease
MFRYSKARVSAAVALVIPAAVVVAAAGIPGATAAPSQQTTYQRSCADPLPGHAACFAEVVTSPSVSPRSASAAAVPAGYGPADLQSAYKLAGLAGGNGRTVAIVDAYDDPSVEADLGVYRSQYGLPSCTTANGCFRKIDQNGGSTLPAANPSWSQEISLDVDMVSAVCPGCKILLVEANTSSIADLATAVDTAAKAPGVVAISNSYGAKEVWWEWLFASHYSHPGIAIAASTGDAGFGVSYPAVFRTVTAVGGTSLVRANNSRGWSETAWSGAGSGCSAWIPKPVWQHDTGCKRRALADVSAVGDPNTGVAVYDSYSYKGAAGWLVFGGTSVSTPIIASVYALGTPAAGPSAPYGSSSLFDVVGGSNGACTPSYLCTAVAGYDGPTGLGTPNGVAAF